MSHNMIHHIHNAWERSMYIHTKTGRNPFLTFCSMLYMYGTQKMPPSEYQSSSYYALSKEQRDTYILNEEYYKLALSVTTPVGERILVDKRQTLEHLSTLAGREWIDLSKSTVEEFAVFITRHKKIIAKAPWYRYGDQISVHDNLPHTSEGIQAFYNDLILKKQYLIEEFIHQHPALSDIYPLSVNTIRLHTARNGNDVRIFILPSLKIGSKGQAIDSGDFTYTVLLDEHGVACSDAIFNKTKEDHIKLHPDTNFPFRNIQIPFWSETKALVKEAALRMTDSVYIGWDVAISEHGPIIIEGNAISGFIGTYQQFLLDLYGHGCRKEIEEMFQFIKGDHHL